METLRESDMEFLNNADHVELLKRLSERERDERAAMAATNTEALDRLGVPLSCLPQKCRDLLKQASDYQLAMEVTALDPVAFSLQHTNFILNEMDDEYEILKLKQKNDELDFRIKENREEIDELRRGLESAKKALANQNPSPENVLDEIHIMRQKVASYEQSYEKIKNKWSNLCVARELQPTALEAQARRLAELRAQAARLADQAEHITLARSAKRTLLQLKANKL